MDLAALMKPRSIAVVGASQRMARANRRAQGRTVGGGPLSEGDLQGAVVTCPRHGAKFDVMQDEPRGETPTPHRADEG